MKYDLNEYEQSAVIGWYRMGADSNLMAIFIIIILIYLLGLLFGFGGFHAIRV